MLPPGTPLMFLCQPEPIPCSHKVCLIWKHPQTLCCVAAFLPHGPPGRFLYMVVDSTSWPPNANSRGKMAMHAILLTQLFWEPCKHPYSPPLDHTYAKACNMTLFQYPTQVSGRGAVRDAPGGLHSG